MRSVCHITPLVINSLGGGHTHARAHAHTHTRTHTVHTHANIHTHTPQTHTHTHTHTHTYTHIQTIRTGSILRNQARAWFKNTEINAKMYEYTECKLRACPIEVTLQSIAVQ